MRDSGEGTSVTDTAFSNGRPAPSILASLTMTEGTGMVACNMLTALSMKAHGGMMPGRVGASSRGKMAQECMKVTSLMTKCTVKAG